jgi:hypothetical protein
MEGINTKAVTRGHADGRKEALWTTPNFPPPS